MKAHTYTLNTQEPINPMWLSSFRSTIVTVERRRELSVGGVTIHLVSGEPDLPVGEEVRVWLTRWFRCQTVASLEREKKIRDEAQNKNRVSSNVKKNNRRAADEYFNKSLNIPVKWRSGYKPVLSGLAESSWGDGINKSSVVHVEMLEDLKDQRLKRKPGDFLCTANRGKQWCGNSHFTVSDGNGHSYDAKITCKTCLKIAERWSEAPSDP